MYRKTSNKALQLVMQLSYRTSYVMLRVLPPTLKPVSLATNQDVPGCATFLEKVESGSTFLNKMFGTCCAFYCPKATVFAASDVTTVYGVTPSLPIRSHDQYSRNLQQPNLLQDRFERDCRGKTRNIASPVVLRQYF